GLAPSPLMSFVPNSMTPAPARPFAASLADGEEGGPMIRALFRIAGLCFLPRMRIGFSIVTLVIALAAAAGESVASSASFATDQRIVYSDGLHNENTAMIRLHGRILLAFRGGEQGQIGSARAPIKVFESHDPRRPLTRLSAVKANDLPGRRDMRHPARAHAGGARVLYAPQPLRAVQ